MAEETLEAPAPDQLRQPMLDLLISELGADVVAYELIPGDDLCVRVNPTVWRRTVELCRDRLGLTYFCFLSGIDWLVNPALLGEKAWESAEEAEIEATPDEVAKVEEARIDVEQGDADSEASGAEVATVDAGVVTGPANGKPANGKPANGKPANGKPADGTPADGTPADSTPGTTSPGNTTRPVFTTGVAGGDTRFQVFARLYNLTTHVGITLKADLETDDPRVDSLVPLYRGADWHEREAWEMYGFTFDGHPKLRHLYLPGEFEGYPLRKDFPLLARIVKPWPGLVNVEPMPGEEVEDVAIPGDEG